MGHLDVFKSLARSAARSAKDQLRPELLRRELQRRLDQIPLVRGGVSDAELTKAVARAPGVLSATMQVKSGSLVAQITDERGQDWSTQLQPGRCSFAPRGAKEVSFSVTPAAHADQPLTRGVIAAVAEAIAWNLWGPVLRMVDPAGGPEQGAFVHQAGGTLTADLMTVKAVRTATAQRLPSAAIEALTLASIQATPGLLKLEVKLQGL